MITKTDIKKNAPGFFKFLMERDILLKYIDAVHDAVDASWLSDYDRSVLSGTVRWSDHPGGNWLGHHCAYGDYIRDKKAWV